MRAHQAGGAGRTTAPRRLQGEARFFALMSAVAAAVTLFGFALHGALGRVDYAALPWLIHFHALSFVAWLALAVAQPWLIGIARPRLHRRLGWAGAALAVAITVLGCVTVVVAIRRGGVPPFFPPGLFLAINGISTIGFGGLVAAAIAVRRDGGWHQRLLMSATILISAPAWARILPMPLLGGAGLFAVAGALCSFVAAGMIRDRRTRGTVHPAWWIGLAVILASAVLPGPIGMSPPIAAFADGLARR